MSSKYSADLNCPDKKNHMGNLERVFPKLGRDSKCERNESCAENYQKYHSGINFAKFKTIIIPKNESFGFS